MSNDLYHLQSIGRQLLDRYYLDRYYKGISLFLFLAFLANFALTTMANAATFTTPSYAITITENCEEGDVACQDVSYVGVNRSNGKSIRLKGRVIVAMCADGVTPCHRIGYEFYNGKTVYFVAEQGWLDVSKGAKVLLHELGEWNDSDDALTDLSSCKSEGMVCAFESKSCAIYTIQEQKKRRVHMECQGEAPIDQIIASDLNEIQINSGILRFDFDNNAVNYNSELFTASELWAGSINNIFIVAGIKNETEFMENAKKSVCSVESKTTPTLSTKAGCSCPIHFAVAQGAVMANNGKYWFKTNGKIKNVASLNH